MPQRTSPFVEGKYGWDFGEDNWNLGMDQNILKFSYLFDRNVDSITDNLPPPVNGQAHYLTTDNRLYFVVGGTYLSSPTPKWFIVALKSTGQLYQFNGESLVEVKNASEIEADLGAIELALSSLGSAAYQDESYFAKVTELDVAEANAANYTDALRQELAADDGASLVGYVRPEDGASQRTISGKLLESVSVLDFDGSDLGAKFNRALQSASGDSYFTDHYKLTIPAGVYDLAEPMVLDGLNKNGIQIQADGVVINNDQDFYSLIMRNCMNPSIRGLHFNMEDNNVAQGCVLLDGNVFWGDFYCLSLLANSANPNFAAVRMKQLNSANIDTGNFWNTFTKFWTRRASSAKPNRIPIGVDMIGSQNATIFDKSSFHSCDSAIILQNDTAASTPYLPGSIIINTTAFEDSGTAITVKSTSPVVTLRGPSVIGSRFEKLDTVIKFDGITSQPSVPPTFVGNSYVLPITSFEVNPNDLYVNVLDSAVTPSNIPAKQVNFNTVRFRNASGPNPVMDIDAKQVGSIRLIHTNGRVDGFIGQAPGGGMLLHGGEFQILKPKHVKSLSGGDTVGSNFRGTVTPASGTTFSVTFTTAEPDANYTPFLSGDGNRKLWWSNKTASGFTINTDTAFAGGPVGWMIIR